MIITFDELAPEAHHEALRFARHELKLKNERQRNAYLTGHARGFRAGWDAALAAHGLTQPIIAELARQEGLDALAAEVCGPFDPKRALRAGAKR